MGRSCSWIWRCASASSLLQRLDLLPVLAQFAVDLLKMLVDLVRVETAHDPREVALRGLLEEVAELGIDVGLHVA